MARTNRAAERAERAAAARRERERQERRRRNLMVGGVVLVVVAIVFVGYLVSRSLDTTSDVAAPAAGSEYGVTIGPSDAPDKVVIYEDFLCPFCGELESRTHTDLDKLADDGKVQVEYRPFNLLTQAGDYSERAAGAFSIVLDRSGAQVAKKFHDLLYENQPSESGPFPGDEELVKLAVQAGADEADVRQPILDGAGSGWVTKATRSAKDAGVQGTPTILLNGKVFQDGRTVDDLSQNLLDQLG